MKTVIVCNDERFLAKTKELAFRTQIPLRLEDDETRLETNAPNPTANDSSPDGNSIDLSDVAAASVDAASPSRRATAPTENGLELAYADNGLTLTGNGMTIRGDFSLLLPRIKPGRINSEMLVKAVRVKNSNTAITVVDATAGLGEDSFLLAAAGFNVIMFEKDPVIAALLDDALARARNDTRTSAIAERMQLRASDSVSALSTWPNDQKPDVVFLDPMFPARTKSAAVKKKFQVIHEIEAPCENETELLNAAIAAHPKKIVIKRPIKGAVLGTTKPSYSIKGKAVRYDCIVLPN